MVKQKKKKSISKEEYERHFKNALSNFGGIAEEEMHFQCLDCSHYSKANLCKAFPKGIPSDILTNDFMHDRKHTKQKNDIVFRHKGWDSY